MKKQKHFLHENCAPTEAHSANPTEDIGYMLAKLKSFNESLAYYNAMTGENLLSKEQFNTTSQAECLDELPTTLKTKNSTKKTD